MEILNILYNNNLIAFYLIGAILVVILIFIVISSISTSPKEDKEILKDPTEEDITPNINNLEFKNLESKEINTPEIPKINDIVENLYQKSLEIENERNTEVNDLNSFLEEYDVPENVIEEVVKNEEEQINTNQQLIEEQSVDEIETPRLKEEQKENIEDMLKRLYDLRQNENASRKNALVNEIYELKKQVDEALKKDYYNYINYDYVDTKVLTDYYLFNEDIEFPKLK